MSGRFTDMFPDVTLDTQELVIDNDAIITAGSTAWQDLALHLVERFAGPLVALDTARVCLIDPKRSKQSAYISVQTYSRHTDDVVLSAQSWIHSNVHRPIQVDDIATAVSVSPRTLHRRFKDALNVSPNAYVRDIKIAAAKRFLDSTDLTTTEIVYKVGYNDPSSFRTLFKRTTGLTPRDYRFRFRSVGFDESD